MKRILEYKLSEELKDIKNNKGEMLYHFIVTNETDKYSLDRLMIFFESTLTEDEILNRSYITGIENNMKHTIPTNTISDIFTFEDKNSLEEYKKQREKVKTTRQIQDERQSDMNWQALTVNREFRDYYVEKLQNEIENIEYRMYDADRLTAKQLQKEREDLEKRMSRMI